MNPRGDKLDTDLGSKSYEEEIDLRELILILWSGKLVIGVITAVFAVGSVFFALSIPNQYKATTLLAPAQSAVGGLSSAFGQLGGLASLAGVSIGEASSNEAKIAQEIMKSWSFIEAFIEHNDLAVEVYAAKGWSRGTDELEIDSNLYDTGENTWLLEDVDTGEFVSPSSWELFNKFKKMLSVSQDKQSGLVTVSIEHYSPRIAKEWLDLYVSSINKHMQARQVAKVSTNISYLEDQIAKTSITEMREVFFTIIEEQTKNKMVAQASPDYAFIAVSPSMVPQEKSKPNRALICVLGTLLGGVVGVLVVLVRYFIK